MAAAADKLADEGKMPEAQALIYQLEYLHPDDPDVRKLRSKLTIDYRAHIESAKLLGKNTVRKKKVERPVWQKVLLYIPDLVCDLKDMVSVSFSLGPQAGVDVHVTRAANVTAFTGLSFGAGTYQKQWAGRQIEASAELSAGPVGLNTIVGSVESPLMTVMGSEAFLVHRPSDSIYQNYRDYWSTGARVGILFFGVSVEIHPIEVADFFTGLAGQDLLNDNLFATQDYALDPDAKELLRSTGEFISRPGLREYHKDFPKLGYLAKEPEEGPKKDDGRIAIATEKGKDDLAHVMILDFENHTGTSNYNYISTSLGSAVYDSMKAGFIFKGEAPEANKKLLGATKAPAAGGAEVGPYADFSEKVGADYLVTGFFSRVDKNTIQIRATIYGRRQKRVLLEIDKKTKTDVSLFMSTQEISDEVIQLMKKLPKN